MWCAEDVRFLIFHADEPPTLPERFFAIRSVAADEQASAEDLAREIEKDQATAAVILKLANAPYYRRGGPAIASIGQAVARLGFQRAAEVALTMSVIHGLLNPAGVARARYLWAHAWAVAQLVDHMASEKGLTRAQIEQWYTSGLLHDIGRWMLGIRVELEYFEQPIGSLWGEELLAAEREMFGVDHAEVGGWLAEYWGLPEEVVQCIRLHHTPSAQQAQMLMGADRLVHEHLPASIPFEEVPILVDELWQSIKKGGG